LYPSDCAQGDDAVKVSCLQDRLAKGLSIVGRAVTSRSVLPVLANILIAGEESRIKLAATNLQEIGIVCWIGGRVDEEGAITVPARLLSEFVGSLPHEAKIDMSLDVRTQTLNLRCATHDTRMKGIDAVEFPLIPTGDGGRRVSIDAGAFRHMIEQVLFAAAADEGRMILTGASLRVEGNKATLAAADGFRLSVRELVLGQSVSEPINVIVPARALSELSRIIGQLEMEAGGLLDIIVTPEQNQIIFQMMNANPAVSLFSVLVEGNFPDYRVIIPTTYTTRVVADKRALLEAVKVAYLFAREAANIVLLTVQPGTDAAPGTLRVAASSAEHGDNTSALPVLVEGDGMEIAFNGRYLIDVLSAVDEPEIVLDMTAPSRPGLFKPKGNDSLLCVIMPMSFTR
jgi:DNA polymerase-3 subunit beta